MQKLAAMQVGINLRYYGLSKGDKPTWDPIVDQIIAAYNNDKSSTHTVKYLLERAHIALKWQLPREPVRRQRDWPNPTLVIGPPSTSPTPAGEDAPETGRITSVMYRGRAM
jgi:hypothetical protein